MVGPEGDDSPPAKGGRDRVREEAFLHPGPNALLGSAFSAGECLGIFTCPHFHTVSRPKDLQPPYDLIMAAFPSCLRFTENVLLPI